MPCGRVLSSSGLAKTTWTPFLTIKTDPREQWIDGVAEASCERAKPVSTDGGDLSDTLLARWRSGESAHARR